MLKVFEGNTFTNAKLYSFWSTKNTTKVVFFIS